MKTTFYKRVGRRYVEVLEYDTELIDSYPQGAHLVVCKPGGVSRKYNVDPNYAGLIAAGEIAQDVMCNAMVKASELKPNTAPLTLGQKKAWDNLVKEFGDQGRTLHGASAYEIVQAGLQALYAEAQKNMSNPSVKAAFDEFIVISKLCSKHEDI